MPIKITLLGRAYDAEVTPPHGQSWRTVTPLGLNELIVALKELGCHQTDIGDALYEADPDWSSKLKHK